MISRQGQHRRREDITDHFNTDDLDMHTIGSHNMRGRAGVGFPIRLSQFQTHPLTSSSTPGGVLDDNDIGFIGGGAGETAATGTGDDQQQQQQRGRQGRQRRRASSSPRRLSSADLTSSLRAVGMPSSEASRNDRTTLVGLGSRYRPR
mmetsp:Transcript_393/g.496  ORF Transcript_393/g.496 Transcript_393/m.496 type:complete len:148 (+) Transcript_393:295-738(+)